MKFLVLSLKSRNEIYSYANFLKNNGILPLKDIKTMSVYGRFSRLPAISGGGSACLDTKKEIIPLHEELGKIYSNVDILYQDIF